MHLEVFEWGSRSCIRHSGIFGVERASRRGPKFHHFASPDGGEAHSLHELTMSNHIYVANIGAGSCTHSALRLAPEHHYTQHHTKTTDSPLSKRHKVSAHAVSQPPINGQFVQLDAIEPRLVLARLLPYEPPSPTRTMCTETYFLKQGLGGEGKAALRGVRAV